MENGSYNEKTPTLKGPTMFVLPIILAVLNAALIALYFYKDIVARKHAIATLNTLVEEGNKLKREIAAEWYKNPDPSEK